MTDIQFNDQIFREFIEELVPKYQHSAVLSALDANETDEKFFDSIGLSLTGEQAHTGFILLTGTNLQHDNPSLWGAIKKELFDFLCTKSKKYSNERKDGSATIKQLILIIATSLAAQFHIAIGVVIGAVTVALMSCLKITTNAWCEINKSND